MEGLTPGLCDRLVTSMESALPEQVTRSATRTLLNVLGTTIGASHHEAVDIMLATATEHGGDPLVQIPGRSQELDPLNAATAIGLAAHIDDFDDTHLETVIHPGAACLAALLATAPGTDRSGSEALRAFALGCEAQLRIGVAISPSHYDAGWHITGTCGVIGAAVTSGLLLGLSPGELQHAVAIATSQTLGLRDAFGTMTKSFHAGKAASNGVLAARLAATGFTGTAKALEHRQGYLAVLADEVTADRVIKDWGTSWELERNTFKPYPCGIVMHPVLDAAIALHNDVDDLTSVDRIVVRCHPLVIELTGNPDPHDGLEARFSTPHGAAVGLADGAAGLAQFTDERVRSDDLIALRSIIELTADQSLDRDAAILELHQGPSAAWHYIDHARGSLERPLSDQELESKARSLIDPVLPGATEEIIAAVRELPRALDLSRLLAAVTPGGRA